MLVAKMVTYQGNTARNLSNETEGTLLQINFFKVNKEIKNDAEGNEDLFLLRRIFVKGEFVRTIFDCIVDSRFFLSH